MTAGLPPCLYRRHRASDWCLPGDPRPRCGICHPPADGLPAVDAEAWQPLKPEAFASHHMAIGHRSRST